MAKEKTRAANATRGQAAKAEHEKQAKIRQQEQASLKALYLQERESPIIADILKKGKAFIDYHHKIAQDGVGARKTGYKLQDGTSEVENYFLSNDEIASEMKKAAGVQELVDYIERQLTLPNPESKAKKKG